MSDVPNVRTVTGVCPNCSHGLTANYFGEPRELADAYTRGWNDALKAASSVLRNSR